MSLNIQQCLKCKQARCVKACPIRTPIPEVIQLVQSGEITQAQQRLFENNLFSSVCSIICDHHRQCFGNCVLNAKGTPINFYQLEQEISKEYLFQVHLKKEVEKDQRIAIIGAGPAGINAAILLALKGYQITLFDDHPKVGGILRYGIPEYRLSKDIVDEYERLLLELKVNIRPNTKIGTLINIEDLLADQYDAVFIASGVWNPRKLDIKGETLGHVHYATDYLYSPSSYHLGDKVIVIGAGNVAMDAARTLKREGKDVSIYYRKSFEDMPANQVELQDARDEGVKFVLFKAPKEVTPTGVIFEDTENILVDGRVTTKILEGTSSFVECDSLIVAVSQSPEDTLMRTTDNLLANRYGLLAVDEAMMTSRKGVFAAGDIVSGADTVVGAVMMSKIAVEKIDEYLKTKAA